MSDRNQPLTNRSTDRADASVNSIVMHLSTNGGV